MTLVSVSCAARDRRVYLYQAPEQQRQAFDDAIEKSFETYGRCVFVANGATVEGYPVRWSDIPAKGEGPSGVIRYRIVKLHVSDSPFFWGPSFAYLYGFFGGSGEVLEAELAMTKEDVVQPSSVLSLRHWAEEIVPVEVLNLRCSD